MTDFSREVLVALQQVVRFKYNRVEEGAYVGIANTTINKGLMTKIEATILEVAEEYDYRIEEQDSYFSKEYGLKSYASVIGERDYIVSVTIEPCAGFDNDLYVCSLIAV